MDNRNLQLLSGYALFSRLTSITKVECMAMGLPLSFVGKGRAVLVLETLVANGESSGGVENNECIEVPFVYEISNLTSTIVAPHHPTLYRYIVCSPYTIHDTELPTYRTP